MYKDAVFISTHKFVGGVQTPGNTTFLLGINICFINYQAYLLDISILNVLMKFGDTFLCVHKICIVTAHEN